MPVKSWSRWAEMRSSIGRNVTVLRSPPGAVATRTSRGTLFGTFTRANRSVPPSGSRTVTARLSERPEMYGNGWAGSTASGVSTGNTCAEK
jgi:hypothetical protein